MAAILSDSEIGDLLAFPKPITRRGVKTLKNPKRAPGSQLIGRVTLIAGKRQFKVTARQSAKKPHSFSVILSYRKRGKWINLIRCNGHHGPHTNQLEQRSGCGVPYISSNTFHIHMATERYQAAGRDAEHYAEPTSKYWSFVGAVEHMCSSYGFSITDDPYGCLHPLFR